MNNSYNVVVPFDREEKERIELFVFQIYQFLNLSLTRRQKEILQNLYVLQIFKEHNVTVDGYLAFIEVVKNLQRMTKLPFSLEDDYAGLGSRENFHAAIDKAYDIEKRNEKRRKKRNFSKNK